MTCASCHHSSAATCTLAVFVRWLVHGDCGAQANAGMLMLCSLITFGAKGFADCCFRSCGSHLRLDHANCHCSKARRDSLRVLFLRVRHCPLSGKTFLRGCGRSHTASQEVTRHASRLLEDLQHRRLCHNIHIYIHIYIYTYTCTCTYTDTDTDTHKYTYRYMYMYMYMHLHVHIHPTNTHVHVHIHVPAHAHTPNKYTYTYTCTCICTCTCTCTCTYTQQIHIHIHMYMYMCTCTCTYI